MEKMVHSKSDYRHDLEHSSVLVHNQLGNAEELDVQIAGLHDSLHRGEERMYT